MEDITGRWANLTLNTKETDAVDLEPHEAESDNSKVLVVKFFTKRRPNMEAITRTLRSMWQSGGAFEIRELGSNTALLLFDDEADVQRILLQGPWTFDKYLIGVYRPGNDASVEDAVFDRASFWVQIHGLPIRRMNKATAEAIGQTLGIVESVDQSNSGDCRGWCIRVRVNIDISQPLCLGRMVNMGGSKPDWISFQYDRLPIFCYWCGLLNHDEKDCSLWLRSKRSLRKEEQQYGGWMRATMERFYKSQPIIKQEGANSDQTNQMPQKASSTLRLTVLTEDEDIRTKDTIGNKDAMHADDEEVIPLPTNKDIITDPALFSTHLQEIDKDLNLFTNEPTLTSEGVFVSQGEGPSTCDPIMASKALDKEKLLSSHCKHGSHVAVKPMNKIDDAVSGNENLTGSDAEEFSVSGCSVLHHSLEFMAET
ncbi:uncharacterized protein CFP56_013819 [Quercus suber]|uniref:DUF4283 domain-containing protein n=1 Tax=Quercus suber TaxID=58331 RepID=A0AAW0M3U0_QUESU